MIVSWNWLGQYVRLDMPVELLAERLALSGLNHESTEEVGGDLAIDLEVTSNRPDCLGHIGVAREVAVLFGKDLRIPDPRPKTAGAAVEGLASVRVDDPDLCPRFTARVATGVKVGPSPWWLRKRLETLGQRPINNVVDITNYVMLECGQPLHAYDLDRLAGRQIIVRRAAAGEKMSAINNRVYEFAPDMLVIADAERPVGLAGVMGGLDTEIGDGSTNVLIEAARFDPLSVRKTVRSLNLPSEASRRFERPIDPAVTEWASRRCAELILELAGGTLHPGLIDVSAGPEPERPPITLRLDQIARVLGIAIDEATVDRILRALGLEAAGSSGGVSTWRAPSWRHDLEREIDLIEEVARIHGYDHIPEDRAVPLASSSRGPRERVEAETRAVLTGLGFDEAYTYSLVAEPLALAVGPGESARPVRVDHSSRKLENALRQGIAPSLLAARGFNEAHGNAEADLFEIAGVFLPRGEGLQPVEPTRLGLVSGRDFFGLKGVVEALLGRFHLEAELVARPAEARPFARGRCAELLLGGEPFGYLGEVDRGLLDGFGLRSGCSAAELAFDVLWNRAELVPQLRPLPPFPAVARDLSLVVEKSLPWSELAGAARAAGGPHLEHVGYLDTFAGGNLPADRQSVHFGLRFRHPERTLTGEEVEAAVRSIVDACATRLGATLRS